MRLVELEINNLVDPEKIIDNFEKLNNVELSFGVHEEDNDAHENRDRIQNTPLYKAYYSNTKPIGNATLLKKNEKGFSTTRKINGIESSLIVAPRPVLKPMINEICNEGLFDKYFFSGAKQQLEFNDINGAKKGLTALADGYLTFDDIVSFVLVKRGGKYWSTFAKHNGSYTQALKTISKLSSKDYGLGNVYDSKNDVINSKNEWSEENFSQGDEPLIDSCDMLKSIKAKVKD